MYNQRNSGGFGGRFKGGDNRFGDRGDKPMFKTTCAGCGNTAEVPFKPNGSKPVYCRECFRKQDGDNFSPRKSFGGDRPSFGDKKMYEAVCNACGVNTEVPFRPSNDKPVYCRDCFKKEGGGPAHAKAAAADYTAEFRTLNAKLDQLVKLLTPSNATAPAANIETVKTSSKSSEEMTTIGKKEKSPAKKKATAKKKRK